MWITLKRYKWLPRTRVGRDGGQIEENVNNNNNQEMRFGITKENGQVRKGVEMEKIQKLKISEEKKRIA